MNVPVSEFLAARSQQVLDEWVKLAGEAPEAAISRGPKPFINAVLVGLTTEDMRPLITYYNLDLAKLPGIEQRLGTAMLHLEMLLQATIIVARAEQNDAVATLDLLTSANADVSTLSRRLATHCVSQLANRLDTSSSAAITHGTSMSITMHELRRPLTILNSYSQLLSSGMLGELPELANIAIEGISSSTEIMIRLVAALGELSRLEDPEDQLNFEDLLLTDILSGAVEAVEAEASFRGCSIESDAPEGVHVRADRRRMILALTNYLSNALKHSPDSSVVTVSAGVENGEAHFVVADEGPGFPDEDTPHLFDKYFRSSAERHRQIPGSGLGLYIVKSVAERHGGRAEARARAEGGAEFEIIIPVAGKPQ